MEEILAKYYTAKEKIKDLQELLDNYKEIIEEYLDDNTKDKLTTSGFNVERKTMTTQRLSKKNCPSDIWDEYSKTYQTTSLHVKKNGERRKYRSRSRSPRSRSN